MKTIALNKFGTDHPMTFHLARYLQDDNLYIGLVTHIDGYAEAWSDLTVNLDGKREEGCAFIDVNNNGEEIVLWLIQNGFGDIVGMEPSGFCIYPEFKFNMDKLMEYVSKDDYNK